MAETVDVPNGRGANARGRRGRPPFKDIVDGERIGFSLRVTPELKRRLVAACLENGRSQSQEIEYRVQQSFWLEDMLRARLISMRVPAGKKEPEQ